MRLMVKSAAYSSTEAQDTWIIHDTRRANKRLYHFVLTSGTATALLEGRVGDGTWITVVASLSAAPSAAIDVYPQMRVRFSAASSFVGYCDLDADGRKLEGFVGE